MRVSLKFGQYQGKGTLIDRHGEVHEGEFKANLLDKAMKFRLVVITSKWDTD